MNGEQLRCKRLQARVPGYTLSKRANISHARLSGIENGHVKPTIEEMSKISKALEELIDARRKVATVAAQVGWPLPPAA